jgi:hypothetical protein
LGAAHKPNVRIVEGLFAFRKSTFRKFQAALAEIAQTQRAEIASLNGLVEIKRDAFFPRA